MFLYYLKKLIPRPLLALLPLYHYTLALISALVYRFPSRSILVIGVTGTKGKSTVTELLYAFFQEAGMKTALSSTIRFALGEQSVPNRYKMTMPGRFFIQRFLREAVREGCKVAVIEMTSEGVKQFRHKWIALDGLVFTNLSPEHIETHGSFEKYVAAKLSLGTLLERSCKRPRVMVANADDAYGAQFLAASVETRVPYSLSDLELYTLNKEDISMVAGGTTIRAPLVGLFNVYNVLAARACARAFGIKEKTILRALSTLPPIKGRVERFVSPKGARRNITAIVDYAHTPDSLTKLYEAFKKERKVCVLGNTGGGRDRWKRPEMAHIAQEHCELVVLTNEDPYDENPDTIVDEMARGIEQEEKLEIIMDRRRAIRFALEHAPEHGVVLITGKGTDPYIMGPHGSKTPWSDAGVVAEEMERLYGKKAEKGAL